MPRICKNKPSMVCYVCSSFVIKKFRRKITLLFKKQYFAYCKVKISDQDKPWAPHKCVKNVKKV